MKSEILEGLPAPFGPYGHVIEAGGFVYTAGLTPHSVATRLPPDGIEAQTELVIDYLRVCLDRYGLDLSDVLKVTVHLKDSARDLAGFNKVYQARFASPYPVRTTVGSALTSVLVEMDVVAFCAPMTPSHVQI